MPKLTVDGLELDVPQGATVLQACGLAGNRASRPDRHRQRIDALVREAAE